jgi:hypothetical protein
MSRFHQFRNFSVFYKMKAEDTNFDKLRDLEEMYDRSAQDKTHNYDAFEANAHKYFRELNRLGEYMAVKRLYEKYHSDPKESSYGKLFTL